MGLFQKFKKIFPTENQMLLIIVSEKQMYNTNINKKKIEITLSQRNNKLYKFYLRQVKIDKNYQMPNQMPALYR